MNTKIALLMFVLTMALSACADNTFNSNVMGRSTFSSCQTVAGVYQRCHTEINPNREDLQMVSLCERRLAAERQAYDRMSEASRPAWNIYLGRLSIPAQCFNSVNFGQPLSPYQNGGFGGMGGMYAYGSSIPWTR